MLTQQRLKELLDYDPETGQFTWKVGRQGCSKGNEAGCVRIYRQIWVDRKPYLAHRLAWFYVHGLWPQGQLDHIDRNPLNNAISNLREANNSQQQGNVGVLRTNKLGVKGVRQTPGGRYRAAIKANKRYIHLGCFDTIEEASFAYQQAARQYFGEFQCPSKMTS